MASVRNILAAFDAHMEEVALGYAGIINEPSSETELTDHDEDSSDSESPAYQYSSLHSLTAFRLIELLPGKNSDPIYCSLNTIDLENAPPFEALSYVWGNPRDKKPIFCFDRDDGSQSKDSILQVTVNCWHALRRLRCQDKSRMIWIDAICINQNDNAERAQQVGLMGNLYRKAACVLIYLGRDDEYWGNTSGVFDLFRDLARKAPSFPKGIQPSAFSSINNSLLVAFRKFFERPWFKRCWTLQEIGVAQRATLICDGDELEWDIFFSVIRWIDKNQLLDKIHLTLPTPELVSSISLYTDFTKEETSSLDTPPDFLDVLKSIRNREATDPKDRIYAFLGHQTAVDKEGPLVIPLYTQLNWVVFYKFALTYIKRTKNLRFLSAVDHGEKIPPPVFPLTWIPWWNPSQYLCDFGMTSTFYDASAGAKESQYIRIGGKSLDDLNIDQILEDSPLADWDDMIMSYSASESIKQAAQHRFNTNIGFRFSLERLNTLREPEAARLSVRGLILDQVKLAWPVLDREDVAQHSLSEDKDPDKHVVEVLCNVLQGEDFVSRYEDSQLALSLTLVAGMQGSTPAKEDLEQHKTSFTRYRNNIRNARGIISKKGQALSDTISEAKQKWPDVEFSNRESDHISGWQQFMINASNACHKRRFFTTINGYFGLGPECMLVSEIFCVILFGANSPFILQKNGDAYRFVGEAYVHGVMNGEVIEMWKRGELEETDFHIY